MMYNVLLHSFIVAMSVQIARYIEEKTIYMYMHIYKLKFFFTSLPVSKTLRKSANHAYTCSFLLPIFIYLSTKHFTTNKWSAAIDFCWNADYCLSFIYLVFSYLLGMYQVFHLKWYQKFSYAILFCYSPKVSGKLWIIYF